MRDVVLYSLLSLDGVAEEPGDWMFDADEAVFVNLAGVIGTQDDVLLGHGTFDYWVDFWPTSDVQPFTDFINHTQKHVFASRPLNGDWSNSCVADAPLEDYVRWIGPTFARRGRRPPTSHAGQGGAIDHRLRVLDLRSHMTQQCGHDGT